MPEFPSISRPMGGDTAPTLNSSLMPTPTFPAQPISHLSTERADTTDSPVAPPPRSSQHTWSLLSRDRGSRSHNSSVGSSCSSSSSGSGSSSRHGCTSTIGGSSESTVRSIDCNETLSSSYSSGTLQRWQERLGLSPISTALQHTHSTTLQPSVIPTQHSSLACQHQTSHIHHDTPQSRAAIYHSSLGAHITLDEPYACTPSLNSHIPIFAAASPAEPAAWQLPKLPSLFSSGSSSSSSDTIECNNMSREISSTGLNSGSSSMSSSGSATLDSVFQGWAQGLQWVHDTTGLPWWAVIPMVTLTLRATLLPLSLRQAAILRTNYGIYKEAVILADQRILTQQQQQQYAKAGSKGQAGFQTAASRASSPAPATQAYAAGIATAAKSVMHAAQVPEVQVAADVAHAEPINSSGSGSSRENSFSWLWGGGASSSSSSSYGIHRDNVPELLRSDEESGLQGTTHREATAGTSSTSNVSDGESSGGRRSSNSGNGSSSSSSGVHLSSGAGSGRSTADWFWGDMAGGAEEGLTAAQHLHRSNEILKAFHLLRLKCGAPHPAWIVINPFVQLPVFMVSSMSLRRMSQSGWPGFAQEGAAWFPNLTTPPVIISTARSRHYGGSDTLISSGSSGGSLSSSSSSSDGVTGFNADSHSRSGGFSSGDSSSSSSSSSGTGYSNVGWEGTSPSGSWTESQSLYDSRIGTGSHSSNDEGGFMSSSGIHSTTEGLSSVSDMVASRISPLLPDLVLLPVGPLGLLLPCAVLAMSLTSLRIGFRAIGASKSGDSNSAWDQALRMLPGLLFTLSFANLYFTLQMPHGVLLHWTASAAFTLSLQLALQRPALRAFLLRLPTPATSTPPLTHATTTHDTADTHSPSTTGTAPTGADAYGLSASVNAGLVQRVAETDDPDVLVIMGAQFSASQRYADALWCLDAAIERDGGHVRAYYSRGQVGSLTGSWERAEADFGRAAELAPAGPERGQAMYCLATALHTQGKLEDALLAYRQASELWPEQAVVLYSTANVLASLGEAQEALEVVGQALQMDAQTAQRAFRQPLLMLQSRLQKAIAAAAIADAASAGNDKAA